MFLFPPQQKKFTMGNMLETFPLFEFSRNNCVAICAILVPANLLATSQTLLYLLLSSPSYHIYLAVTLAVGLALIMICHVATWLMIGVVQIQTFILLGLGCICLLVNLGVLIYKNKEKILSLAP